MDEIIRAAVVGCGMFAAKHLASYKKNPRVELAAVADVDITRAEAAAAEYEAKPYPSVADLLAGEQIDVASVTVPVCRHAEVAQELLEGGVHVLCEKPLTARVKEARRVVELAEEKGRVLTVGYAFRFTDMFATAKRWLEAGRIGKIMMARLHFAHILNKAGRGWYGEIDCGGGIVRESSTHSIDLFRWLVGDVAAVCGQAGTFGEQMTDAEDSAAYLLRSTNGALGVIDVSWATPVSQNRVEIYGADGSIVVDIDQRKATCRTIDGGEEVFSGEPAMAADRVYCEIDLLIDVIAGQAKPLVTAVDGVRAVEVAEAVMKSIKTKRWVQL